MTTHDQLVTAHVQAASAVQGGRQGIRKAFELLATAKVSREALAETLNADENVTAVFGKASVETLANRAEAGAFLATDLGAEWFGAGGDPLALAKRIGTAKQHVNIAKIRACLKVADPMAALTEAIAKAKEAERGEQGEQGEGKGKGKGKGVGEGNDSRKLTAALEHLRGVGKIHADNNKARNLITELEQEIERIKRDVSQTIKTNVTARQTSGA